MLPFQRENIWQEHTLAEREYLFPHRERILPLQRENIITLTKRKYLTEKKYCYRVAKTHRIL